MSGFDEFFAGGEWFVRGSSQGGHAFSPTT